MGPRETEEALCVPSPSAAVKQFYSLLLTCFVWVLFFMVHIFFKAAVVAQFSFIIYQQTGKADFAAAGVP